jgi:hypothetical protein
VRGLRSSPPPPLRAAETLPLFADRLSVCPFLLPVLLCVHVVCRPIGLRAVWAIPPLFTRSAQSSAQFRADRLNPCRVRVSLSALMVHTHPLPCACVCLSSCAPSVFTPLPLPSSVFTFSVRLSPSLLHNNPTTAINAVRALLHSRPTAALTDSPLFCSCVQFLSRPPARICLRISSSVMGNSHCACTLTSMDQCGSCGTFGQCFDCDVSCQYKGAQCARDTSSIFYSVYLPVLLVCFVGIPLLSSTLRAAGILKTRRHYLLLKSGTGVTGAVSVVAVVSAYVLNDERLDQVQRFQSVSVIFFFLCTTPLLPWPPLPCRALLLNCASGVQCRAWCGL